MLILNTKVYCCSNSARGAWGNCKAVTLNSNAPLAIPT
nr:MAG TPA: hypothetical protein [Inoviridae sp.]